MIDGIVPFRSLVAEGGSSGWGELVFFLVIMLFSVFGSVIKSIAAKRQQKRRQDMKGPAERPAGTWQQRLARRAEEFQQTVEAKYQQSQQPSRSAPPAARKAPEPGKLTIRTGPDGESLMVYEKDRDASMAQHQAERQRQAHVAAAAARQAEAKRLLAARRSQRQRESAPPAFAVEQAKTPVYAETPAETFGEPNSNVSGVPVISYDDPDALRKAILHYEILGKLLACRDPFDRNSLY